MKRKNLFCKGKFWIPLGIMALGAGILLLPGEQGHCLGRRLPRILLPQGCSWDLVALISGGVFLVSVGILVILHRRNGSNRN